MKIKRLSLFAAALILLIGMLPATAFAAGDGKRCRKNRRLTKWKYMVNYFGKGSLK